MKKCFVCKFKEMAKTHLSGLKVVLHTVLKTLPFRLQ